MKESTTRYTGLYEKVKITLKFKEEDNSMDYTT